jgi:A/G-specific adenine glycosylase
VVARFGGRFPDSEAELKSLPGIGTYTSAAIAAIAFGRKATVMDGNVERVIARVCRVETPLPEAKPDLYALAAKATPDHRPGDYAQAMMDLGATICTPRKPRCMLCPLERICMARKAGVAELLPARQPKADRPVRRAVMFWIRRADGAVLMRRRPESGLLGGLMEFPSTPWIEGGEILAPDEAAALAPVTLQDWRPLAGTVIHVFTHFRFEVAILAGSAAEADPAGLWVQPKDFGDYALPTLMTKIARHALAGE